MKKTEEREDWMMIEYYAKLDKSKNPLNYGCAYCDKTHLPKNCPNRKQVKEPEPVKNKSMYDYSEDDAYSNPNNYGW